MASIIKSLDRRSGITYVYSSESYWDKEKKAPRCRRTLIGKIDKNTGEVIPTNQNRRKAMERKAEEAKSHLADGLHVLETEYSALLKRYKDALEQFDKNLQILEKDIQCKREEIGNTQQTLSDSLEELHT